MYFIAISGLSLFVLCFFFFEGEQINRVIKISIDSTYSSVSSKCILFKNFSLIYREIWYIYRLGTTGTGAEAVTVSTVGKKL